MAARKIGDWLEERSGYRALLAHALEEPVRGGASFAYVFGSMLAFLLLLQFSTGVLLALYYSPSATDAWASVAYIEDSVTLGWLVRGLHGHGASAIVLVSGMHMLQTAIWGAYKRPRELNWIVGVLLLGLLLVFALTGYLLPWDQTGYWATKVATGIAGTTPVIGQDLQAVMQGGNEYGNLTLTRFYALHVLILPGTLLALTALHLALFRRHGITTHFWLSRETLERRADSFWPHQAFKDVVAIALTFVALFLVTFFTGGVELSAPADPSSQFDARPEWYFRPLFQLLKLAGSFEQVVSLGLPALLLGLLMALPFVDRGATRDPRQRIVYLAPLFIIGVLGALLTFASFQEDAGDEELAERVKTSHAQAVAARKRARESGVPVSGPSALLLVEKSPVERGRKLWDAQCAACHQGAERKGPEVAAGYNSRAWIRAFLTEPSGDRFFGRTEITDMPPVKLSGEALDAAVEAIYAESGAADVNAALAERGKKLIADGEPNVEGSAWDCNGCHPAFDYKLPANPGPNLTRRGSPEMLAEFIALSGHPRWFGAASQMPPFFDALDPAERRALAEYLVSLRDEKPTGSAQAPAK